jgi:hypothetical protein
MAVGVIITPMLVLTREIVAADKCGTSGGTYDYLRAICDMTGGTYVPFVETYGPLVWVGALLCLKLAAVVLFAFWTPAFLTRLRLSSRIPFLARIPFLTRSGS